MTARYAVIGNPIGHSRSPQIHAHFARACRQDMAYGRILAPVDRFRETAEAFRAAGGQGLNVTAPFQLEAYRYVTKHSVRAFACGSVNAVKFEDGEATGENFDGVGLEQDLVRNRKLDLRGLHVLLLGTGGSAHGVLPALLAQQPARVVVAHMDEDQARDLAARATRSVHSAARVEASDYRGLAGQRFDAVFNATSASLWNDLPPVPVTVFNGCFLAYELAYGDTTSPFLRLATNAGVRTLADGLGMLAEQAAEAFAWWRNVRPSRLDIQQALLAT